MKQKGENILKSCQEKKRKQQKNKKTDRKMNMLQKQMSYFFQIMRKTRGDQTRRCKNKTRSKKEVDFLNLLEFF